MSIARSDRHGCPALTWLFRSHISEFGRACRRTQTSLVASLLRRDSIDKRYIQPNCAAYSPITLRAETGFPKQKPEGASLKESADNSCLNECGGRTKSGFGRPSGLRHLSNRRHAVPQTRAGRCRTSSPSPPQFGQLHRRRHPGRAPYVRNTRRN